MLMYFWEILKIHRMHIIYRNVHGCGMLKDLFLPIENTDKVQTLSKVDLL